VPEGQLVEVCLRVEVPERHHEGQPGHGAGREGLHLHSGPFDDLCLGFDLDQARPGGHPHRDVAQEQGVAEGDQLGGELACLDACDLGHDGRFRFAVAEEQPRVGTRADHAPCDGPARRGGLRRDVDHAGLAVLVDVGEAGPGLGAGTGGLVGGRGGHRAPPVTRWAPA
jgi:hypothetical protein